MADVRVSSRYEVSGDKMWERIGDPGKLWEWHPAIARVDVFDGGKRRVNTVVDGSRVSETILEHADRRHTYRIDDSPLPFASLVGTLRVRDEGATACVVDWEATVEPSGVAELEAVDLVRGFFQAGLDAL